MLIVNADDWGRSAGETDRALSCVQNGRVTSVTAMVFMQDSHRAAAIAKEASLDVGLHLNLTQPFTAEVSDARLLQVHRRIVRFLRASKYALLFYHPLLRDAFGFAYRAQAAEFERLYGRPPSHIDGHQHMHLCSNMLMDEIIPSGTKVRRSFSFFPGEKDFINRFYRRWVDRKLARRHRLTDYFFALSQNLAPQKLARVARLASSASVELMTHPVAPAEYELLLGDVFQNLMESVQKSGYASL
jgi:predicted glycoside hydrolase/deacetylase ChbG (UPF0249 family)